MSRRKSNIEEILISETFVEDLVNIVLACQVRAYQLKFCKLCRFITGKIQLKLLLQTFIENARFETRINQELLSRTVAYCSLVEPQDRFNYGRFGGNHFSKRYLYLLTTQLIILRDTLTFQLQKHRKSTDFIQLVRKVLNTNKIYKLLLDQYSGINSSAFKDYFLQNRQSNEVDFHDNRLRIFEWT